MCTAWLRVRVFIRLKKGGKRYRRHRMHLCKKRTRSLHLTRDMSSVQLSKKLTSLLRHNAEKEGLHIQSDGFVCTAELVLHLRRRWPRITVLMLADIAARCPKKRFEITADNLFMRASQGHSMTSIEDDKLLELITDASTVPTAVHGTYRKYLDSIMVRRGERTFDC